MLSLRIIYWIINGRYQIIDRNIIAVYIKGHIKQNVLQLYFPSFKNVISIELSNMELSNCKQTLNILSSTLTNVKHLFDCILYIL